MVVDDDFIGIHLPFALSNDAIKSLIKERGATWEPNFKIWKMPKSAFTEVRSEMPRILPEATIEDIPAFLERASRPMPERLRIL